MCAITSECIGRLIPEYIANKIKKSEMDITISIIGSHVQALPYEILENEKSIDLIFTNEGVYALRNLLSVDFKNKDYVI